MPPPNGACGEPVARRRARPVRRTGQGNGPGESPTPRPDPILRRVVGVAAAPGQRRPGFFTGGAGEGLNYSLVISIMVCLFVGRVVARLSRRCAGFHAPAGVLS